MVDALLWHRSGQVIFVPSTATPATGGVARFFDAGTSDARTVYTDSTLSTGVTSTTFDSNGVVSDIWLPTGSFKVTLETSAGVVFATHDNQLGATDTSSFLTGTVAPSRAIITKSGAYTTVAADHGKQINANASGGDFTLTLDSAVDYADGGDQLIKNVADTGVVTVAAPGAETIDGQPSIRIGPRNSAVVRSDGSGFYTSETYNASNDQVSITYASSITPDFQRPTGTEYVVSTVTGDMTVNNPDNARPGTRGTFRFVMDGTGAHKIDFGANYNGEVYIDESANATSIVGFVVTGASSIELFSVNEPREPVLSCILRYAPASGTAGQTTFTQNDWNKVTLDSSAEYDDKRSLSGLSASVWTLLTGTYRVVARFKAHNVSGAGQARIRNTSDGSTPTGGTDNISGANSTNEEGDCRIFCDRMTIAANKDFELQYYAKATGSDIGVPATTGEVEQYVSIEIYRYAD